MFEIGPEQMIDVIKRSGELLLPADEIIRLIPSTQDHYQFLGREPFQLIRLEEIIEDDEGAISHIVTLRGTMMEQDGETIEFPAWTRPYDPSIRPTIGEEHWVSSATVAAAYYVQRGVGDREELQEVLLAANIYPAFTSFVFQKRMTFEGFIAGNHVVRR